MLFSGYGNLEEILFNNIPYGTVSLLIKCINLISCFDTVVFFLILGYDTLTLLIFM